MMRNWAAGLLVIASMASSTQGWSQPPPQVSAYSSIGVRNANAPTELRQLEFLIGTWKASVVLHNSAGDLAFEARWHNSWIIDGFAIMQEWRDQYATGAEVRTYNAKTRRWEGRNYYSDRQTWTQSDGAFANGEFVIDTPSGDPGGQILSRERYFDIQPNSFRIIAARSSDGGKTWTAPLYEIVCTRIG